MSENHQILCNPGLVHYTVQDRHFQDTRIGKCELYQMGSTEHCVNKWQKREISSYHKQLVNLLHHQFQAFACSLEYHYTVSHDNTDSISYLINGLQLQLS